MRICNNYFQNNTVDKYSSSITYYLYTYVLSLPIATTLNSKDSLKKSTPITFTRHLSIPSSVSFKFITLIFCVITLSAKHPNIQLQVNSISNDGMGVTKHERLRSVPLKYTKVSVDPGPLKGMPIGSANILTFGAVSKKFYMKRYTVTNNQLFMKGRDMATFSMGILVSIVNLGGTLFKNFKMSKNR